MKKLLIFVNVAVLIFGLVGMASAGIYGTNITIFDTSVSGGPGTWYNRGNNPGEDQEVEPNCVTGQIWDYEGFFLKNKTLTMVGGFDFKNGVEGYPAGDIFIGKLGKVIYGVPGIGGSGNNPSLNVWNYDYVLQMNYANQTYSVFALTPNSTLINVTFGQNIAANPWNYQQGGDEVQGWQNLQFTYTPGLNDAAVGFLGDADMGGNPSHNVVTGLNLGFLPYGDFVVHSTMKCGNDNLMGAVPLPPSVLLLASGLVGLVGLRYRRRTKG